MLFCVYLLSKVLKLNMKKIIILCVVSVLLTNCLSYNYYGNGNFTHETTPLQKPTYRGDTLAKASYISATINTSFLEENFVEYDKKLLGSIAAHKAYTKRGVNYAFGGFTYLGSYDANDYIGVTGGNFSFYGIGATGEFNINVPAEKFDWRIIGLKLTLLTEGGEYSDFKDELKEVINENDAFFNNGNAFFGGLSEDIQIAENTSLAVIFTSEVVYKDDDFDLGYSFAMGGGQFFSFGNKLFLTKDKLTVFVKTNSSNQGNYGGLGVSYQIK